MAGDYQPILHNTAQIQEYLFFFYLKLYIEVASHNVKVEWKLKECSHLTNGEASLEKK